jgi:hypothetical protein
MKHARHQLMLLAFAARIQPKDAFDLHQMALHYDGGPAAVITGFVAEREANSGFAAAREALEKHFASRDANGPLRGAERLFQISRILEQAVLTMRTVRQCD